MALPEKTARFCNNPACELCDVYIKPRDMLRKGGFVVCPRGLEPLVVRRLGPRVLTLPSKPAGARRSPRLRP